MRYVNKPMIGANYIHLICLEEAQHLSVSTLHVYKLSVIYKEILVRLMPAITFSIYSWNVNHITLFVLFLSLLFTLFDQNSSV